MFKILYKKILWLDYSDRQINSIDDNTFRKDYVYELLVKKYFNDKKACNKILLICERLELNTITELSFLSYVYALNYDWNKSIEYMWKVIDLENWENIDSWIDYWHFLRKVELHENISNKLLLNIDYYMKKYSIRSNLGINKVTLINFLYE